MEYTDTKPSQIIINNVSREKYKELSISNQLCTDQVYVITDVVLDAVGLKVANVANPTQLSDSANKIYVDSSISSALSNYYDKSTIDSTFQKYTIINKLTQAEYDVLSAAGQIKEDELYVITDSKNTTDIINGILSSYYKKTETSSSAQIKNALDSKQTAGDYALKSTTLTGYGITDAKIDNGTITLGANTITPLTAHQSLTAYETKADLTSNYYTKTAVNSISTSLSNAVNSNYYKKTETSSAAQISTALNNIHSGGTIDYIDGVSSDLSINNVTEAQMATILEAGDLPKNAIYIVSSDTENMFGQRVTNVGTPISSTDAATKEYVDSHSGGGGSTEGAVLYNEEQSLTDAQKTQVGVNAGFRYALTTKTLENCTYDGTAGLSCLVDDYAVNTINISSDSLPIFIFLPEALDDRSRDFVLKLVVTASDVPTIAYVPYGDETVDYDTNDDTWSTIEQGTNIIAFTEMSR